MPPRASVIDHLPRLRPGALSATYRYDGDGQRVKATVNGTTTYSIGNYLELSVAPGGAETVRKYYYAGGTRVAVRGPYRVLRKGWASTGDTGLSFLLGDHLGSTSVTAARNRLTIPTPS